MFRPVHGHVPPPPGAGLIKLADPRRVVLGWVGFVVLVIAAGTVAWPYGLGEAMGRMRRQFVAIGYLRGAQAAAHDVPARREQALASLNRAVSLAPDQPVITEAAAQLFVELRAYREAVKWLRQRPDAGLLERVTLAQSLLLTGETAAGEQLMAQVERDVIAGGRRGTLPQPLHALVLNNIAYVNALAQRNLPQALQMATQAVTIAPDQPAFIDSLGWVEYQLGRHLDAAFHLEQAVRLALPEESAEMYYHLGAAYARTGRREQARTALRRALELDPSYREASDELRLLSEDLPVPSMV